MTWRGWLFVGISALAIAGAWWRGYEKGYLAGAAEVLWKDTAILRHCWEKCG